MILTKPMEPVIIFEKLPLVGEIANPTKAKFLIATLVSTKPLSKSLRYLMLKLFFGQIHNYNKQSFFFSGINFFWTILHNEPVINSINNLNRRSKALSISCFKVSAVDTKIPHNKLIIVFNELVDFCFKGVDKK